MGSNFKHLCFVDSLHRSGELDVKRLSHSFFQSWVNQGYEANRLWCYSNLGLAVVRGQLQITVIQISSSPGQL